MKTPRLALIALALPALLLASSAKAGPAPKADALPTWPVVDESFRAWPTIYFTVGKDNRALRCRYSECNPETNKGQSNLYVMIESGARVPIDATIYEYTPLPGWDPRSWYGSPESRYSKRPRVVKAHRQNYTTQLSNFKLDNTGGKLFAVQNGIKYAATTDIRTTYMSETGGVVAVAPPTKKAADAVKPDGSVPPVPPERQPNRPVQYRWCETATGNSRISPTSPGAGWTKAPTQTSTCKKPDDTRPAPPPDAASPLELSAKEKQWLTKGQAAEYEEALKVAKEIAVGADKASAMKDLVDRTRKTVTDNLQPNAAAISAYTAAAAAKDATNAKIDATLPAEVWGGPNSAIVGPFGDRLDIQLSKEEWTALAAPNLSAALTAYKNGRKGSDGNKDASAVSAGDYNPAWYDPIKLHLVTMAARAAVGPTVKPPVTTPPGTNPGTNPGGGNTAVEPLSTDELKLLSPKERQWYKKLQQNVIDKQPDAENALKLETERLRKLIVDEKRADNPYKVPTRAQVTDPKQFADLPKWHKDTFCNPDIVGAAAAASDKGQTAIDNGPDAMGGAKRTAADGGQSGATSGSGGQLPDWAVGPCAIYNGTNNGGTGRKQQNGPDLSINSKPVEEDTVANSWFMRTQVQTFAQGSLIGLVIGSLFGPIGLIAGPILGGLLAYGMQKYDAVKEDKAKKLKDSAGE